jgi:hypothetical protein
MKKLIFFVILTVAVNTTINALNVIDFPTTLKQFCGATFDVFSTGDEFYNRVHDKNDFTIVWDGTDENNRSVSSGIYFYRLKSVETTMTRKMVLIK